MSGLGDAYVLSAHCCRHCFGRLLQVTSETRYRCANCGAGVAGDVKELCACGIKLANGKDAGIRCRTNSRRSPDWPGEVVAEQIPKGAK